QSKSLFGL
ncbi:curli production assembly/transport component CsgG family protein, partial [Vibrio harveyi]